MMKSKKIHSLQEHPMFNKKQLEIIYQLLSNATFKTPEARLAMEVNEICEMIVSELKKEA